MPKHVMVLLGLFYATWLYTEVTEFQGREAFNAEIETFMHEGGRNTNAMGQALCDRVAHLESIHHGMESTATCLALYETKSE